MSKFIFGLGAAVLALVLTGDAKANGPHGGPVHGGGRVSYAAPAHQHGHVVASRPYHLDHAVRYNAGYIYRGHDHQHWGSRVWNTRYNRYQYWDTDLRCYYYWNPTAVAYYPCS